MKKRWKIGVIYDTSQKSKGHHGTHLSFTGLPNVEQVLADPNTAEIDVRMKSIGAARHYRDYREMIDKERPDIVTVCSRLPGDHFEVIKIAVEHGCHILCEKPRNLRIVTEPQSCAFAAQKQKSPSGRIKWNSKVKLRLSPGPPQAWGCSVRRN